MRGERGREEGEILGKKIKILSRAYLSKLLKVIFDILESAGCRETADENLLGPGHHLKGKKSGN